MLKIRRTLSTWMATLMLVPSAGWADGCDGLLGSDLAIRNVREIVKQQSALRTLNETLSLAFPGIIKEEAPYRKILSRLLIPGEAEPSDLVTLVFTGAARMGKSTLVNAFPALANQHAAFDPNAILTPTSRRGGTTRRPLIVIPRGHGPMFERRMAELRARFPGLERVQDPQQLREDGPPLFVEIDGLEKFPNLVIIDTPDLTTGDIREHAVPRNAEAAREALLGADVVLAVLDDDNLRDLNLSSLIADNYKTHGYRNSAFFLRTDARSKEDLEESRGWLVDATRGFYNEQGEGAQPDGVLALFSVEKDSQVGRTINPRVSPFAGSPELVDFLGRLSRESAKVRGHAARAAARAVFAEIKDEITKFNRARDAAAIYHEAIVALSASDAPTPAPIDFPYERNAAEWRAKLNQRKSRVNQIAEGGAQVASLAGKTIKEKGEKILKGSGEIKSSFANVVKDTDEQVKAGWIGYLHGVLRELQQGQVTLPKKAAEDLLVRVTAFNTNYPDARIDPTPREIKSSDLVSIDLPKFEYLPADGQANLRTLFRATNEQLIANFTKGKDTNQTVALIESSVDAAVASIVVPEYKSHSRSRDFVANVLTNVTGFAGPFGAIAKLGSIVGSGAGAGVATVTVGAVSWPLAASAATIAGIGLGAATVLRLYLEGQIDGDLKPMLESWFTKLQEDTFRNGFRDGVLQSVVTSLESERDSAQAVAVAAVSAALHQLGADQPEVKP